MSTTQLGVQTLRAGDDHRFLLRNCYKISCIAVIFAHQIFSSLIHYWTTLTMHRESDKNLLNPLLAIAVIRLFRTLRENFLLCRQILHTLVFLSSRSPVRNKKSGVKIRPGWVTHVKWSFKPLRKSLLFNCLLSSPICVSVPFHVTSLGNISPPVTALESPILLSVMVLDVGVKDGMKMVQKCKTYKFLFKSINTTGALSESNHFLNNWNQFNSNESLTSLLGLFLSLPFCGEK